MAKNNLPYDDQEDISNDEALNSLINDTKSEDNTTDDNNSEDNDYTSPYDENGVDQRPEAALKYGFKTGSQPIVGQKAAELLNNYQNLKNRTPANLVKQEEPSEENINKDSENLNDILNNSTDSEISPLGKKQSLLDQYKQLLQQKSNTNRNLTFLQGGNQIAQALASGSGGKIGDASDVVNNLRKDADKPVEGFLGQGKAADLQSELNAADPNSDISKFARQQALNNLKKANPDITPEQISKIEQQFGNMSAKEIEGLTKGNNSLLKANGQHALSVVRGLLTPDGHPVLTNPNGGGMIDAVTKLPIDPATKLVNQVAKVNPVTGQLEYTSPNGSISLNGNPSGKQTTDKTGQTNFQPNVAQRTALQKEEKQFDKQVTQPMQQIRDADSLVEELASNNKLQIPAVKDRIAKIAKGAGALTQYDEQSFGGSQALIDRLNQMVQTADDSTFTPENRKAFSELLKTFTAQANQAYNDQQNKFANRMEIGMQIPSDFTKNYLGNKPTTPHLNTQNKIQGKQDPKIDKYAKDHSLDYGQAKSILTNRGYTPNEQ